jgi:hypothetical protein
MRLSALPIFALAFASLMSRTALAAEDESGKVVAAENQDEDKPKPPIKDRNNILALKNALYMQSDRGGNPHVDENAMIVESLVVLRKEVAKEHVVTGRFKGAIISSASYDLAKQRGVLVSGATTRIHNPGSGEVGLGYVFRPNDFSIGINGTLGFEHAYRARGLGVDVTKSLFDDNTTLSLFAKGYYDTVRMIRFDGSHDDDQLRRTIWTELGWTQILTPISLFNLTLTHVEQWGFLATSFNSVFVGPTQTFEVLPRTRSRNSGTLRYKQALDDDNAIELGYRYYRDDWDIHAHTLSTAAFLYLKNHTLLLEPLYRYHYQSESKYFARDRFDAAQPYMTSDSDLGTFSGHMFALNIVFIDVYFLWLYADYDIAINYYHRTDGIDMVWMTMGFDLPI